MIPDQQYWQERAKQIEEARHRDALQVVDDLYTGYVQAEKQIEADITTWYQRFGNNNGCTSLADAKRLLTSGQLKELRWTLEQYQKAGRENGVSADWSKELENASARWHISRLEALKLQVQNSVETLAAAQYQQMDELMRETFRKTYGETAFAVQQGLGTGWTIGLVNDRKIEKIIQTPWTVDGRNFSDRIWANKTALIAELQKELTQNMMTGGNLNDVIDRIQHTMGVSRSNAARLVLTENAYMNSVSAGESYRATGVEKVIFVATLDDRTSDICRTMDGTIIDMKDYAPGSTVPPLHPYCRSVTAPYYADMEKLGERAARDPVTGKTYTVPRDMTYSEWEKTVSPPVPPPTQPPPSPPPVSALQQKLNAAVTGATMKLADCKTVEEVQTYMNSQGYFRGGRLADLSGTDLECAKATAEAYDDVMQRYPFLKGELDPVSAKILSHSTYAQCWTRSGGGVEINTIWFGDSAKILKQYQTDLKAGFHPVGTTWKDVVIHELGHSLDGFLSNKGLAGMKNYWETKDVSALLRPSVMKATGHKVYEAGTQVSNYATKNAREFFAECFAEGMRSASPRAVAAEFMKQLAEIIKNGGL